MPDQEFSSEVSPLDEFIPVPSAEEIRSKSKKKKKRKTLLIVGIILTVLVIAGAGIFALLSMNKGKNDKPAPTIEPTAIYKGDFEQVVTAEGTLEPVSSVLVNSELGGTVSSLSVVEGQQVKKGDELFTSRNTEINDMAKAANGALSAANSAYHSAASAVEDAKVSLKNANADVKTAERALERAKSSGDQAAIEEASMTVSTAKQMADGAKQGVASAEAQLSSARLERENATNELAKINRQLEGGRVIAPIDGTVIAVNIKEGSQLGVSMPGEAGGVSSTGAIEIADLSRLVMRTAVTEEEVVLMKNGDVAKVTFAALPGLEAVAKLVRVAPRAVATDPNMNPEMMGMPRNNQGPMFNVDVEIENPDPRLKYGMSAEVSIMVTQIKNVFMVNKSALIQDGSKFYVEELNDAGESIGTKEVKVLASTEELAALDTLNVRDGMMVSAFPTIDGPVDGGMGGKDGIEPAVTNEALDEKSSPELSEEELKKMDEEKAATLEAEASDGGK